MIFSMLLKNPHSASVVFSLFYQSLIIFFAGWAIIKLFKRASAPIRSALNLTTIIIGVLLPLGIIFYKTNDTFLQTISLPFSQQTYNIYLEKKEFPKIQFPSTKEEISSVNNVSKQEEVDLNKNKEGSIFRNTPIVILNSFGFLWLCGILFQTVRFSLYLFQYRSLKRELKPIDDIRLNAILFNVKNIFQKRRVPQIFSSNEINSPCTMGIFNPVIAIPTQLFEHSDKEELEAVVFHEISHIYHKDHILGLFQIAAKILYWWNPLVKSLAAHYLDSREFICDNEVIQAKGAHSYASQLWALAQKTNLVCQFPCSMGIASRHISLAQRIKTIISKERSMDIHLKKSIKIFFMVFALAASLILARQSWTIYPRQSPLEVIPLPELMHPELISADSNQLIIKDDISICTYSLSDFSLVTKFGKKGQGPGEFRLSPMVYVFPDEYYISLMTKVWRFSRDGDLIEETKLPFNYLGLDYPLLPVGENYVGFPLTRGEDSKSTQIGYIYDSEFQKIKQFYEGIPLRIPPPPPPAKPGSKRPVSAPKQDFEVIRDYINYEVNKNKIFVADTRKGFFVSVFDENGQLLSKIDHEYEELKVPNTFKKAFFDRIRESDHGEDLLRRYNYLFRNKFPAFVDFQLNNGRIYVTTHNKKDNLYEIVILNLEGDILRRSFSLPSELYLRALHDNRIATKEYVIDGEQVYSLKYNEDENRYDLLVYSMK